MSPRPHPASTSSRSRCARKRASATYAGLDSAGGDGARSSSARQALPLPSASWVEVKRSSAAGPSPGRAPPGSRPASSGENSSPKSVAPTKSTAARTSGLERKLPRSGISSTSGSAFASRRRSPEDLEVRVPEAVDRLELVADAEQSCLGTAQRIDEGELDAVRVLELVDHDMGEAHAPRVPHGAVVRAGARAPGARGPRSPRPSALPSGARTLGRRRRAARRTRRDPPRRARARPASGRRLPRRASPSGRVAPRRGAGPGRRPGFAGARAPPGPCPAACEYGMRRRTATRADLRIQPSARAPRRRPVRRSSSPRPRPRRETAEPPRRRPDAWHTRVCRSRGLS